MQYLQDCAIEARLPSEFLYIDEIGLGDKGQLFALLKVLGGRLRRIDAQLHHRDIGIRVHFD